ncbi:MAG: esterase-like activity of phytase family protein [Albidovulum sp.]
MRTCETLLQTAAFVSGFAVGCAGAAELVAIGQFTWQESDDSFGGFSGLVMAADGTTFHAVTDRGEIYEAAVTREADRRITAIRTLWHGRLLDNHGKLVEGFTSDAEALASAANGGLYVAYESYARVTGLNPSDLHPVPIHEFDRFRDLWNNESFEGLAERPEGGLIVVIETAGPETGGYATFLGDWAGDQMTWRPGPDVPAGDGDYGATDAAFGPDGRFYLLERRFSLGGYSSRIRRFGYREGGFGAAETLLETTPGTLDNMEGMSLWTDPDGRTIISLISDDNFLFVQKTIVAEYELKERP